MQSEPASRNSNKTQFVISCKARQGKPNSRSSAFINFMSQSRAPQSEEKGVREMYKQNQVAHNQKHNL